jgi:hypothetical protein
METCDLNDCDFLETRFLEYSDENAFLQDTEREYRGVILYFVDRVSIGLSNPEPTIPLNQMSSGKPYYEYMPLDVPIEKDAIDNWIKITRDRLRRTHSLYETIYWYMADFSCILVERNKQWFSKALPKIEELWNIILKERETGYEHRAAKKRILKPSGNSLIVNKLLSEEI